MRVKSRKPKLYDARSDGVDWTGHDLPVLNGFKPPDKQGYNWTRDSGFDSSTDSLLKYSSYLHLRKNGLINQESDFSNSYLMEDNNARNEQKEMMETKQHFEITPSRDVQNGHPPGAVFKYYRQFDDYWNVFPKTDYTYSPSSRYYKKEVAPGIPVIPNLSRRSIHHKTDPVWVEKEHEEMDWKSRTTWLQTICTTVTTVFTTVTTTIVTISRTLSYPKVSPNRTIFVLLLLLILPLLYYLFFMYLGDEHEKDTATSEIRTNPSSSLFQVYNFFMLLFHWLMNMLSTFLYLIYDSVLMIPVFINQAISTSVAYIYSFSTFWNNPSAKVTSAISSGKTSVETSDGASFNEDHVLSIVLKVLAKQNEKEEGLKNLMKQVMLEHEDKIREEKVSQFLALTKELYDPVVLEQKSSFDSFMKQIRSHMENIEKKIEDQKKDLDSVKPQIQKLEEKLNNTEFELTSYNAELARYGGDSRSTTAIAGPEMKKEFMELVENVLAKYHADRTGKPDYALLSNGGMIVSIRCTQAYKKSSGIYTILGIPFWNVINDPEIMIKPGAMPGECWAFEGSEGYIGIQLAIPIYVTSFTLEHTPKELTHHGHIKSAPHVFSVWGLKKLDDDNPTFLGRFEYVENKGSIQTYDAEEVDEPFHLVELRIESNHGNLEYTCIYRFRVHGKPANGTL